MGISSIFRPGAALADYVGHWALLTVTDRLKNVSVRRIAFLTAVV
jgi:hypothetical protein